MMMRCRFIRFILCCNNDFPYSKLRCNSHSEPMVPTPSRSLLAIPYARPLAKYRSAQEQVLLLSQTQRMRQKTFHKERRNTFYQRTANQDDRIGKGSSERTNTLTNSVTKCNPLFQSRSTGNKLAELGRNTRLALAIELQAQLVEHLSSVAGRAIHARHTAGLL